MDIETLIEGMVSQIRAVPGVSAVVLGGSRARGTQHAGSDIDLAIYYRSDQPVELAALNRVAAHFDDAHRTDILTAFGGWGPWINGGGWLTVQDVPVDFLYRDLRKVDAVIADCQLGKIEIHYQPGHPLGFLSSIYMGEISVCKLLWENPEQEVSALKERTDPYPRALQRAIIEKFGWEIDFSLGNAHKGASRGDVVYAAGCCFRAAACLLQCLFAANGQYWLNEKGAAALIENMPLRPANFRARLESAFTSLAPETDSIQAGIDILYGLSMDTDTLLNALNS